MRIPLFVTASLLVVAPAAAQQAELAPEAQTPPAPSMSPDAAQPTLPDQPVPVPVQQDGSPDTSVTAGQSAAADQAAAPDSDEILVSGRRGTPPGDPLEGVNLQSFEVVQAVDANVVAPMANGYKNLFPEPMRAGVRNFFSNLTAPATFINFMLQFKVGKAAETVARFGLNSTVGVAGLVDVARRKPFRLPPRRNGFANTLGFYGIKTGPFLFLPLVGPTTVRDLIGLTLDKAILPLTVGAPFGQPYYTIPSTAISSLDYRNQFDEQLRKLRESPDPYAASREFYLRNREAEIEALRHPHRVQPAAPPVDPDKVIDPEDEGAPPAQERF